MLQIGLRMPEDKENPSIKDILLMESNVLLAVDNGNKCLKAIAPREGGGHKYLRIDTKTRPWGLTRMQPNVVAVSGHQCLYVVTVVSGQCGWSVVSVGGPWSVWGVRGQCGWSVVSVGRPWSVWGVRG